MDPENIINLINQYMWLAIVIFTVLTLAFVALMFVVGRKISRRMMGPNTQLLQIGIPGHATIRQISQTGLYVNNLPQIELALDVQVPGQAPYQADTKLVIPLVNIPQFQPGVTLPVKVDPQNPQRIALDIYA